jgi:hypothetical protein
VGDAPRKDPDQMARVLEQVAGVARFPDARWLDALAAPAGGTPGGVSPMLATAVLPGAGRNGRGAGSGGS